ncbi:hypothetical protein [Poseidonia sp.]|uniref:hypothetical protein n=1 Tax=Poseidonia sp. TaxID=2666344 RepID=UPI003F6A25A4
MFGRKKKEKEADGHPCPYCEFLNPEGAETCVQCYYSLNKSAREQPMAKPTTTGEEIMGLLLGDNELLEEDAVVVEAVLSLDDVTVDVDQYEISTAQTDEDGEVIPESFQFIEGDGPTLSETISSEEEEDVELQPSDAPASSVMFEIEKTDPFAEVAEPVHTGKGGLYSPSTPTANDDDLLGSVGPNVGEATPDLPDLPDDEPVQSSLAQATAFEAEVAATPELPADIQPSQPEHTSGTQTAAVAQTPLNEEIALPELPDDDDVAQPTDTTPTAQAQEETPAPPIDNNRIWPWPQGQPWDEHRVYQEVVEAMEHIKHGRMSEAATTLDTLGPHLHENLNMLLHISVLMQHLGRHDHVKWTLDMAAYVHPAHPEVLRARSQLLN